MSKIVDEVLAANEKYSGQFGEKGKQSRWLAAPQFTRLISNGILQFTPDASREETEEIAKGLNNIAKKNESNEKW